MDETPDIADLLDAVRRFLDEARRALDGHPAFHALVAANVVDIARREIELGPAARAAEADRLRALMGRVDEPETLNRALCRAIRDGTVALDDDALLDHLEKTTLDQIAIDQPGYSGARVARES